MNDKKDLIKYDYDVYNSKYNELLNGAANNASIDGLSINDMKVWLQEGVFCRRLKFRKSKENFYITTASISRGKDYNHDFKLGKDYIIPYWGDQKQRAQTLMKFDIGNISPANGKLDLIGDFTPFEDNLLNVKYQTVSGKKYIKNAKEFINGKEKKDKSDNKIDISRFFRLKFELASQGSQAKALYDTKNSIIDGSAGTGKSTIAIQKLKYFYENNSISQDKQLIIVRNKQLKFHFSTLLNDKNINLPDIKIQTIDESFDIINVENIELFTEEAKQIKKELNLLIQKRDIQSLAKHYYYLFNFIGLDFLNKEISNILKEDKNSIKDLESNIKNLKQSLNLKLLKSADINKLKQHIDVILEFKRFLVKLKNLKWSTTTKKSILLDFQFQFSEFCNKSKLKSKIYFNDQENEIDNELKLKVTNENEIDDKLRIIQSKVTNYESKIRDYKSEIEDNEDKISKIKAKEYKKVLENLNKDTTLPLVILDDLIPSLQKSSKLLQFETLKLISQYKNYLQQKEKDKSNKNRIEIKQKEAKSDKDKKALQNEINNLNKRIEKKFTNNFGYYYEIMKNIYFSRTYLEKNKLIKDDLIYKILEIEKKSFDTIIIDEAQDFSKYEIELIRLHTKRIILTGDILQNIHTEEGLLDWNEILNINLFENDEKELNKYSLKHNFRQTYQLANVSYNYRQLLLDEKIEDIGFDYFESEKIFNGKEYPKPTLSLLEKDLSLMEFIEDKFKNIDSVYTDRFPIIIVYKSEVEKEFYNKVFQDYTISEDKNSNNPDIILLGLDNIKGNEFPIVIANMNSFTKRELYLIMTRAQFELELFIKNYEQFNPVVYKLIQNNEQIQFLNLKNIEINNILINEHKSIDKLDTKNISPIEIKENKIEIEEEKPTTKIQIPKHKAETSQYSEDLDPDIITNEEKYQEDFTKKVQEDIKDFNEFEQKEIVKEIIVVKKSSTDKKSKELRDNIKNYLMETYKGYCQICGFSFRKVADGKNSFEMFNWNDKRVVKQKKGFVTTADSLCLCRNCSANIKWGSFSPTFIDKINSIENFTNKNIDDIKEIICPVIDENIVDRFKKDYEWDDMYAFDIELNKETKNIYFTNGHLIQFIAYLQLEENMQNKATI